MASAASPIALVDVTRETGIDFKHTDGGCGRRYIMETFSAGLALFDYDQDGDVDVYFLNGAPLEGTKVDRPPRNALYRNDGNFRFTDVTEEAGVGDPGFGLGVAVGDYDNDGLSDIYLSNYGPNVMYHNNGDGTFTDLTGRTGTAGGPNMLGAGVSFLDADGDGYLDLYVSSYLDFTNETHPHNVWMGFHVYPSPEHYRPTPDAFYRNNGDGTFSDVSVQSGIASHRGRGMGVISTDYDNDGDTDVFVANDSTANFLFENQGNGKFEEVGLLAGVAYDVYGERQGSMGVDCADCDGDGLPDFYLTSYQRELTVLYKNLGDGLFDDVTAATGAAEGTLQHVTWGTGLVDFDNDSDRDVFIACGHLYDNVELFCDTTAYRVRNILLMNTGKGQFVDVSGESGDGMTPKLSSRGVAFDDLDNDGDIDVVILNSRSRPTLLRNDSQNDHHWLQVRLRGRKTNRDGVGARVRVVAGDLTLVDEVHSGRSYQSHYGMRLHFGLGKRARVDRVEVRWIGGGIDVVENAIVDRLLTITEGGADEGIN